MDGGSTGSSEVGAFMDAGQLAVEGAASAEAVSRFSRNGSDKAARPEWSIGGCGKGFFFGLPRSLDNFELFGARFDEFRLDGDGTGPVVSLVNGYGGVDLTHGIVNSNGDLELGWSERRFDIDTGESVPGWPDV